MSQYPALVGRSRRQSVPRNVAMEHEESEISSGEELGRREPTLR